MSSGLTQRRRNMASDAMEEGDRTTNFDAPSTSASTRDSRAAGSSNQDENDEDYDDDDKGNKTRNNKLTILEEVLLMGLKDAQVLRGAILMELSFRDRITTVKEIRKRPFPDRLIEVTNEKATGEVLLDEALRLIKTDSQSISAWIDLLSGETWNLMKIGYQLKQVRERIAKGLVDKGVLRTEKRNFVLFDMATHPVSDHSVKEALIQRTVDALLGRGPPPDRRTIGMVCAAYAANVLENALVGLTHAQREAAFVRVDELLQEVANYTDKAKAMGATEVMAGVFSVYTKGYHFIMPAGNEKSRLDEDHLHRQELFQKPADISGCFETLITRKIPAIYMSIDFPVPSSKYQHNITLALLFEHGIGGYFENLVTKRVSMGELAIWETNSDPNILPNVYVDYIMVNAWDPEQSDFTTSYDSGGYNAVAAMNIASAGAVGVVGPILSKVTKFSAKVLSQYNIPNCGADQGSPDLSDKNIYNSFFRMRFGRGIGRHVVQLMHYFKVKRVALVIGSDTFSASTGEDCEIALRRAGIKILTKIVITPG
ncbi:hypothetical protein HDU76_006742, partial [Blyttiomyces sp. JEL0837]